VALMSSAAVIITPLITPCDARSKRPARSAIASTQVATTSATIAPSFARSACGSATQIRTIAAPPAISHPMARARARLPAQCASITAPYPNG
jgi:hypothetical protein